MTTLESLSKALLEESRQIDWRCLVLENLREFATLVWYFVADSQSVECVIPRMLKSLGSVPFDPSQPLLTYNEARTMVITHAIEAVQINSPQWGSVFINGLFVSLLSYHKGRSFGPHELIVAFMRCRVFSMRHSISQSE